MENEAIPRTPQNKVIMAQLCRAICCGRGGLIEYMERPEVKARYKAWCRERGIEEDA